MNRLLRPGCPLLAAAALAGCAGLANEPAAIAPVTPPAQWRFASAPVQPLAADWWHAFGDPVLDGLVATALRNNTDLALAASRVQEARAQQRAAHAARAPQLLGGVTVQRSRSLNDLGLTTQSTIAEPNLQLSYEFDLWGRLAQGDAAARAALQASESARGSAALSVAAATASAYIGLRTLDARLTVAQATLAARGEALRLARSRAQAGYTSQLELDQAKAEYEATAQLVSQAGLQIARQENTLRLLLGEVPGEVPRGLALQAMAPPVVPGSLPSTLLRQRPDIAEAEQRLAAADASLAAARAQFLPQVRLNGSLGALFVDGLPGGPVHLWSLGGSVLAPLFDGGRIAAQADTAVARRDQAALAYRRVALAAFKETDDALAATQQLAEVADAAQRQRDTLAEALRRAHNRYQAGYASYLEELDAQRGLLSAELGWIQARSDQLNAAVALSQALGGSWASK